MRQAVKRRAVLARQFQDLTVDYDREQAVVWCKMHASPRPCFSENLLGECQYVQDAILNWHKQQDTDPLHYVVLASSIPDIFNLGGDLDRFEHWIRTSDRPALREYAKRCVDVCYYNAINYGRPDITTIALVQGDALGGGFESALSATVLVAERQVQFGLPEILFSLFPGMGSWTLLIRRVGVTKAEEIIRSGRLYTAEELHELGIVDVLAERGQGVAAVRQFIESRKRTRKGHQAIDCAKLRASPVSLDELTEIVDIWVETALALDERDLKMMRRLVKRQTHIPSAPKLIRRKDADDRRDPNSPGTALRERDSDRPPTPPKIQ